MEILEHMDRLLMKVQEQGREAQHWVIRQRDWLEIGERFRNGLIADPTSVGSNTYMGVPVHFSHLNDGEIVGIVDRGGERIIEAR